MTKLTADIQANCDLFVTETKETQVIWGGLCNEEGDWLSVASSEFENSEVMPFWSSEESAKLHCADEWGRVYRNDDPVGCVCGRLDDHLGRRRCASRTELE